MCPVIFCGSVSWSRRSDDPYAIILSAEELLMSTLTYLKTIEMTRTEPLSEIRKYLLKPFHKAICMRHSLYTPDMIKAIAASHRNMCRYYTDYPRMFAEPFLPVDLTYKWNKWLDIIVTSVIVAHFGCRVIVRHADRSISPVGPNDYVHVCAEICDIVNRWAWTKYFGILKRPNLARDIEACSSDMNEVARHWIMEQFTRTLDSTLNDHYTTKCEKIQYDDGLRTYMLQLLDDPVETLEQRPYISGRINQFFAGQYDYTTKLPPKTPMAIITNRPKTKHIQELINAGMTKEQLKKRLSKNLKGKKRKT